MKKVFLLVLIILKLSSVKNNACPTPQLFKLRPSPSSITDCVTNCAKDECYHPFLFTCVKIDESGVNTNIVAETIGGKCICKSSLKLTHCIDKNTTTNMCITPSSGKLANSDGDLCTSVCKNTNQCYKSTAEDGSTFICLNPDLTNLSNGDGLECVTDCGSGKCFNGSTFICASTSSAILKDSNNQCKCQNVNLCFSRTENTCISPNINNLLDGAGGKCLTICPNNTCFKTEAENAIEKFTCTAPASGRIFNGDNFLCTSTCKDKNKCYDSNFNCVDVGANIIIKLDGGSCSGNCTNNTCRDTVSKKCRNPGEKYYLMSGQNDCLNECGNGSCLHPKKFTCITTDDNIGKLESNGNCYCKNLETCLNPEGLTCITPTTKKYSNQDGTICVSSCDSTKCFNSLNNKCIDKSTLFKTLVPNSGGECYCIDSKKCVQSDNTCYGFTVGSNVTPAVSDGDGSYCKNNCSQTRRCYDSTTKICIDPANSKLSNNTGGQCLTECATGNCYNPLTFICNTPRKNLYLSTDKQVCVSTCLTDYCWSPTNFTCISTSVNSSLTFTADANNGCLCIDPNKCVDVDNGAVTCISISVTNTKKLKVNNSNAKCLANCPSTHCYHPVTGICYEKTDLIISLVEGSICTCADENKCIARDDFSCISANSNNISDGDGSVCKTSSNGCTDLSKCYTTSDYICKSRNYSTTTPIFSKADGKECLTVSGALSPETVCNANDTNMLCFNEILVKCVVRNNTNNYVLSNGYCACASNFCLNHTTGLCVDQTAVDFLNTGSYVIDLSTTRKCKSLVEGCSALYCIHPTTDTSSANYRKCITKQSNMIINSNYYCGCSDQSQCLDTTVTNLSESSLACKAPVSGKISDGDGTTCKKFCSNKKKCINPSSFICEATTENGFDTVSDGYECRCITKSQCIDNTSGNCTTASKTSSKIANGDGGLCTTTCTDKSKCFGSDGICIAGSSGKIVKNLNGEECGTRCTADTDCYHPLTFRCSTPVVGDNLVTPTVGGECTCTNTSQCISPSSFSCITPGLVSSVSTLSLVQLSNGNGKHCTEKCSTLSKCYKTSDYICITPVDGFLSNNNGEACTSTCSSPNSTCINNYVCTSLSLTNLYKSPSSACLATCEASYCLISSKFKCVAIETTFNATANCVCATTTKCINETLGTCEDPVKNKFSNKDGSACLTSCPETKCWHPSTFACENVSASVLKSQSTGECYCANLNQCIDSTVNSSVSCIAPETGKRSHGDGGLCDTTGDPNFTCKNLKKCMDTDFICKFPSSGKISNSDGKACLANCSNTLCYHPSTYYCQETSQYGMTEVSNGSVCICSNKKTCVDPLGNFCIFPTASKLLNDASGGLCTSSCSAGYCYNDISYTCILGSPGNIVNSGNGVCTTSCNSSDNCYNPSNYVCQVPTNGSMNASVAGGLCSCSDSLKCIISNGTCGLIADNECVFKSWYDYSWLEDIQNQTIAGFANTNKISYFIINSVKTSTSTTSPSIPADVNPPTTYLYYIQRYVFNTTPSNSTPVTKLSKYVDDKTNTFYANSLLTFYGHSPKKAFVAFDFTIFSYTITNTNMTPSATSTCYNSSLTYGIRYKIKYFQKVSAASDFYTNLGSGYDKILYSLIAINPIIKDYMTDIDVSNISLKVNSSIWVSTTTLKKAFLKGIIDGATNLAACS